MTKGNVKNGSQMSDRSGDCPYRPCYALDSISVVCSIW